MLSEIVLTNEVQIYPRLSESNDKWHSMLQSVRRYIMVMLIPESQIITKMNTRIISKPPSSPLQISRAAPAQQRDQGQSSLSSRSESLCHRRTLHQLQCRQWCNRWPCYQLQGTAVQDGLRLVRFSNSVTFFIWGYHCNKQTKFRNL